MLKKLAERKRARLEELKAKMENGEVRSEDLATVQAEVANITDDLKEIAEVQAEEATETVEETTEEVEEETTEETTEEKVEDTTVKDNEQRAAIMSAIGSALSTRSAHPTKRKETEIRSAFANFVIGKISEAEARSLGIEAGNGTVTVPEVIASEVIAYAQEENLLRKYGTIHRTKGDVKFPVLVKKADAHGHKKERGLTEEIEATGIEFDEILLDPSEFDALATVTKKLLKMTGAPIERIVIDELKKAYVRKETAYMFNGDDAGNENPGALAKKAVGYYEKVAVDTAKEGWSQRLYAELVRMKNQPVTEVLKKSMWIVNRAALTLLESMVDATGRPLLHVDATDGVSYKLLGHKLDFTDAADAKDSGTPVFYFGDFKAFHIQDVVGSMEIQKMVEQYARTNRVGFQIYNLLDGQLVYSAFEPAVYRYEVGAKATVGDKEPDAPITVETRAFRPIVSDDINKPEGSANLTVQDDGTVRNAAISKLGGTYATGTENAFVLKEGVNEMTFETHQKQHWIIVGADDALNNVTLVGVGASHNIANATVGGANPVLKVNNVDKTTFGGIKNHAYKTGETLKVINSDSDIKIQYKDTDGAFKEWITIPKGTYSTTDGNINFYEPRLGALAGISSANNDNEIGNDVMKKVNIEKVVNA